ncbi:hypothetical protein LXL04_035294 [Taraxacum kok-saghyz]
MGNRHTESAKFKHADCPLNAKAATSCALAAITAVGCVPSHTRNLVFGSLTSQTHLPLSLVLTPRYTGCLVSLNFFRPALFLGFCEASFTSVSPPEFLAVLPLLFELEDDPKETLSDDSDGNELNDSVNQSIYTLLVMMLSSLGSFCKLSVTLLLVGFVEMTERGMNNREKRNKNVIQEHICSHYKNNKMVDIISAFSKTSKDRGTTWVDNKRKLNWIS